MTAPAMDVLNRVGPDPIITEAAEKLGITDNVHQLERDGYTVIPPEKVGSTEFVERLRDTVVAVHRRRTEEQKYAQAMQMASTSGLGELMGELLWEDPVFEQALMNPVAQTLARAMAGHTCRLSAFEGAVKPQGDTPLVFHADSSITEPWPVVPQFANVTYALTEYSPECGSTKVIPGSHRLLRQPVGGEAQGDFTSANSPSALFGTGFPEPVSIECPAGSIIAWYGSTWHGASPRTAPGERVSAVMYFSRWYLKPQSNLHARVPDGALDRHSPRLAQLIDLYNGWEIKDPTRDMAEAMIGRTVYPILDVPRP
ncbi:hypothetical protein VT50_0232025 [Streptomyces antioxidans]|uniref:Phytanoyl-CoA dioxygenase n=1 Tax=Streptomyces antioxidans TaxID=1507734 RepID=A0A1V4CW70_9ACTN|nr:phytanoyl-CoA dioxygenase family protein [Streptomyces antioxidans]OPF72059.1 hypothetical protein VT50_0232025 [Streptomyces antioxidans]